MATTRERQPAGAKEWLYTAADVAVMPSELPSGPVRYELDNGKLVTLSPPSGDHCAVELRIAAALYNEGERKGRGRVRCGNVKILLWQDPDRIVVADAVFIGERSLPVRETPQAQLETVPDLVIDVLDEFDSKAYIDRKLSDYLRAGVKQVWIADPVAHTLTVHCKDAPPHVLGTDDVLRCDESIPGFSLPIAEIFCD